MNKENKTIDILKIKQKVKDLKNWRISSDLPSGDSCCDFNVI